MSEVSSVWTENVPGTGAGTETVTTKTKNKHPGRVEWGKKLAVISAETKRRKKLQAKSLDSTNAPKVGAALESEHPETYVGSNGSNEVGSNAVGSNGPNSGTFHFPIILALGSLVIGAGALYYTRQSYFSKTKKQRPAELEATLQGDTQKIKSRSPALFDME